MLLAKVNEMFSGFWYDSVGERFVGKDPGDLFVGKLFGKITKQLFDIDGMKFLPRHFAVLAN